jgi:hypothetical protein
LAFTDELRQMLKIIRFGKHCSCYLKGEYVMDEQYVELDFMVLIGGAEEQVAIQ